MNPEDQENRRKGAPELFTSRMTTREAVCALLYLPVHVGLLPLLLSRLPAAAGLSDLELNLVVYGIGAVFMLLALGKFFRREFDPLCDHFFYCILQVLICYCMMMAFNLILSVILVPFLPTEQTNPNNEALMELAGVEFGKTAAIAVFLAPLVEEPIFRGGIFGMIQQKNRTLALAASMLLFSLYHVWAYAIVNPVYWIYLLQYLPASWLLCRCYERCNSIWGSVFLHMLINGISIRALSALAL